MSKLIFGLLSSLLGLILLIGWTTSAHSEATFYEHKNLGGNTFTLKTGDSHSKLSNKGAGQVWERKNWNDRISSIKIGACTKVVVYEHANFAGRTLTYENPYNDVVKPFSSMPSGWNDLISSVKTFSSSTCTRSKTWGASPSATGKILEIGEPKLVSGSSNQYKAMIRNRTDYFYGITISSCAEYPSPAALRGANETFSPTITPRISPRPGAREFTVQARFNLFAYYLQAAWAILFQQSPPTDRLGGVVGLIAQKTGKPVDGLLGMDAKWLAEQFVQMAADPVWAKRIAQVAGKPGAEQLIMSKAKTVLGWYAVYNAAQSFRYFVDSLRAPEYEQIIVQIFR